MADVVKVTIFVTDISQREKVWQARREFFTGNFPDLDPGAGWQHSPTPRSRSRSTRLHISVQANADPAAVSGKRGEMTLPLARQSPLKRWRWGDDIMQIKLTIALVAAVFALTGSLAFAADMPADGTKNFTAPGDAPSYFANETVPASARVANQAAFTEDEVAGSGGRAAGNRPGAASAPRPASQPSTPLAIQGLRRVGALREDAVVEIDSERGWRIPAGPARLVLPRVPARAGRRLRRVRSTLQNMPNRAFASRRRQSRGRALQHRSPKRLSPSAIADDRRYGFSAAGTFAEAWSGRALDRTMRAAI